jgi:hypothetical protein
VASTLLGLQLKKGRPPSLSAIYVPQTTTLRSHLNVGEAWDREIAAHYPTLALSRLSTESLYVSGPPGTGTSTFCRWVAWLVAEGAIPSLEVTPPQAFTEVLDDGLKGRLPVLLRLREFWEYLPTRAGASLTVSDLEDAVAAWVDRKRPDGLDAALFRAHLKHGSALLLLDGMDEVPVGMKTAAAKWLPLQPLVRPAQRPVRRSGSLVTHGFALTACGCPMRICSVSSGLRRAHSRWGAIPGLTPNPGLKSSRNTPSGYPSTTSAATLSPSLSFARSLMRADSGLPWRNLSVASRTIRSGSRSMRRCPTASG